MDMIAKKHFRYGGTMRAPGDPVTLQPKHVRLFRALGRVDATEAPVVDEGDDSKRKAAVESGGTYGTRDMIAQTPAKAARAEVPAITRGGRAKGAQK